MKSEAQREKAREHQRQYRLRHPERVKAAEKKYKKDNSEKVRASILKWQSDNPEKVKTNRRAHRISPKGCFHHQRCNAKARGIEWEFTFAEWWAMWEPHWENRGCGIDQMVMCRTGDAGPYSPDNCRIDTVENNQIEYWR
jgi:hypothetical protein